MRPGRVSDGHRLRFTDRHDPAYSSYAQNAASVTYF